MNTQLATFLSACNQVKLSAVKTSKYKLMYMFGAWVTADVFAAESDEEAILDATEHASKLASWKHGVALFCGNRLVHRFN